LLASLILFSPLLGFFLVSLLSGKLGDKLSQYITSGLLIFSTILSWIIFIKILNFSESYKIHLFNWINSGNLNVEWSIRIDTLSAIMLIVVTTVSSIIHIYSIGYMSGDPSIPRFMGYLSLFTFFMLALVTSDNLLQMFFGWEGVGLSSYLLIGFWHHKKSANNAAIKAFIVNRIGDFGYILGLVGVFFIFNTIYFDDIFSQVSNFRDHKFNFLGIYVPTLDTLCILLFIGAMGKSAQLGLHTWLPDAMEGPTPVSALIHAATMVTAGVFLVARMSPIFEQADLANNFMTLIGASTAIFAATVALTQNDIKKVIAYSTCSQLGYMFFAAGVGAYNASMFHLTTHAFFKALLFLCAGSVIHSMNKEQDMRKMGGLSKKMPITTILMWIGSLAIIGFPLFSGYYSKESILESTYFANSLTSNFAYTIGVITTTLTAFYSWRLLFMTFHGKFNSSDEIFKKIHESPYIMLIPMILLGIGSVIVGKLFFQLFIGNQSLYFWSNSIIVDHFHVKHLPFNQVLIIKLFASFGIFLASIFYYYKTNLPKKIASNLKTLYLFFLNKWYFDEIYNQLFVKPSMILAKIFWIQIDNKIIDKFGPNGLAKLIKVFANTCGKFQTGYLYHYAFTMLIGLVFFLSWYLY